MKMLEDRANGEGLLCLSDEELRSVRRNSSISDVYDVEDTVFARGKFATVRRANHKTTGVQYAAKYIKKRRRAVDMTPEIHHEISVLLKCAPSNRVVRLHEMYETNSDVVLVLELAAGGELQRIFDTDHCLNEIEARRAMRQILEGLCYLHEKNIAHLDLKPQNLLLTVEDCCDDIKLCDFGVSRLLAPGTEVRALLGTPDYVAPEVLSYEPISLATDIWSVGVLAYVLLSGYTPFGADTKQQTYLNISQCILTFEPDHFGDVSGAAIDFIKSSLLVNPRLRPTVQDLLLHPWISPKNHILPPLSIKAADPISITPKTTPISQRRQSVPESTTLKSQKEVQENDEECDFNEYINCKENKVQTIETEEIAAEKDNTIENNESSYTDETSLPENSHEIAGKQINNDSDNNINFDIYSKRENSSNGLSFSETVYKSNNFSQYEGIGISPQFEDVEEFYCSMLEAGSFQYSDLCDDSYDTAQEIITEIVNVISNTEIHDNISNKNTLLEQFSEKHNDFETTQNCGVNNERSDALIKMGEDILVSNDIYFEKESAQTEIIDDITQVNIYCKGSSSKTDLLITETADTSGNNLEICYDQILLATEVQSSENATVAANKSEISIEIILDNIDDKNNEICSDGDLLTTEVDQNNTAESATLIEAINNFVIINGNFLVDLHSECVENSEVIIANVTTENISSEIDCDILLLENAIESEISSKQDLTQTEIVNSEITSPENNSDISVIFSAHTMEFNEVVCFKKDLLKDIILENVEENTIDIYCDETLLATETAPENSSVTENNSQIANQSILNKIATNSNEICTGSDNVIDMFFEKPSGEYSNLTLDPRNHEPSEENVNLNIEMNSKITPEKCFGVMETIFTNKEDCFETQPEIVNQKLHTESNLTDIIQSEIVQDMKKPFFTLTEDEQMIAENVDELFESIFRDQEGSVDEIAEQINVEMLTEDNIVPNDTFSKLKRPSSKKGLDASKESLVDLGYDEGSLEADEDEERFVEDSILWALNQRSRSFETALRKFKSIEEKEAPKLVKDQHQHVLRKKYAFPTYTSRCTVHNNYVDSTSNNEKFSADFQAPPNSSSSTIDIETSDLEMSPENQEKILHFSDTHNSENNVSS